MTVHKDARLIAEVREILQNCHLDDLILDREVQLNMRGERDDKGNFLTEKEIDVVARLSYGGKRILLLFECEDSNSASGVKKHYREYNSDIGTLRNGLGNVHVLNSADGQLQSRHFRDVDLIRACFVYGKNFRDQSFQICLKEARPYSFLVWNYFALTYYRQISRILRKWTRYELFKDFALNLEATSTFRIKAMEVKQKGRSFYLGTIHPGLLLKIAYVVRRASERTLAYQRMLNKDRIDTIAEFISSSDPQSFIPNAVIVVVDDDPKIRSSVHYDSGRQELTLPKTYCSAWMIDGQHRAYGFLGTAYEDWTEEKHEPFELPVIVFVDLPDPLQTQTFININYFQKRIKSDLLCDLTTSTKDLQHKLTWPSLIGRSLNEADKSPLKDKVKISELHHGRPISMSSLVQYGLLETLLGFKSKPSAYLGPLYTFSPFDRSQKFEAPHNQTAFNKQVRLLIRFLEGVRVNTQTNDPQTNPWENVNDYSLLKPTGINALFMVLAKILNRDPGGAVDFGRLLRPLRTVSFRRDFVRKKGGGWKGFRELANTMIRRLNRGKGNKGALLPYGKKEKM